MRTVSGKFAVTLSAVVLALTGASAAGAQTQTENAGAEVLRRIEPSAIPEQKVKPRAEIKIVEPTETSGAKVTVQSFVFDGNHLLSANELALPLKRFIGQQLTLAELNYAADLIGKLYQERGFFARAVVPAQDVADGAVRIQIVESRLDRVEIDASTTTPHQDRIRAYIGAGLKQGDPLDLRRIERGTLLLNQVAGNSYRAVLRAGSTDGTSSVVLVPELGVGQHFSALVDNAGSTRSGKERMLVSASLQPSMAFGDDLTLAVLASRGVQYGRVGYSLPIGSDGLSASLSVSGLNYKLLKTPVTIKGNSEAAIAGLRYPLVLQSDRSVQLSFEGGYRRFSDRVATLVTNRSLAYGSVSIDVSRADAVLSGGNSGFGISVLAGRTSTDGGHVRISGYAQRRQMLTKRDSLTLRAMAQSGSNKLDPSQFLMINGSNGVLAASNDDDVSGRSGVIGRATLEHEFVPAFKLSAFYDIGKVSGASANRPTMLQGFGAGAVLQVARTLVIDASIARPINSPTGFNGKMKAWINARVTF